MTTSGQIEEPEPESGRLAFLGFLVLCSILWLLLMTCLRENWGFWQSPKVYHLLPHEYPQWMRAYVKNVYQPFFVFTVFQVVVWTALRVRVPSGRTSGSGCVRSLLPIILIWTLFGFTLGVMCANNLVGLVDRGHLHGYSHILPWKR